MNEEHGALASIEERKTTLPEKYLLEDLQGRFWALRGRAIQAYSQLEQALFELFASLTGMPPDMAGIIFFKITNSRARSDIIRKLFRKRHGANFNLFLNSIIDQLQVLDAARNEIVHWNAILVVGENGEPPAFKLAPPTYVMDGEFRNEAFIVEFSDKCSYFSSEIGVFVTATTPGRVHGMADETRQSLLERFSQSLSYPPPQAHTATE